MTTTTPPTPLPSPPTSPPAGPAAIGLPGVTRRYGAVRALDALDLEIRAGESLALLGPNGAGKSTAMEMMVGLATPDTGTVSILGADRATATRTGLIGTMLQAGA